MNPLDHIGVSLSCDLCGGDVSKHASHLVVDEQKLLQVSVKLTTLVCRQCRFIFQGEVFSDELLAAMYHQDTSFDFGDAVDDMIAIDSGLVIRQAVISRAMRTYSITDGAAVLDLGGGRGECCQHLVERHRVVVADATECPPIDPRMGKIAGLFSNELEKCAFDVVVMNHVIEHVFSPSALLASAHKMLREGGIIVVEVPFELYTPLVFRRLGDWRHVAYFCRATLRQFLEKAGFAVGWVSLEDGCYGARRLPVVRAVAQKVALSEPRVIRNSVWALFSDMISFIVMKSIVHRILVRR